MDKLIKIITPHSFSHRRTGKVCPVAGGEIQN